MLMKPRKIVPMSDELRARWERAVKEVEQELPDLVELGDQMLEASAEDTLSGLLRRAIHRSRIGLAEIASDAGVPVGQLNEFLSGERTLRSDVMDRLAAIVNVVQDLKAGRGTGT